MKGLFFSLAMVAFSITSYAQVNPNNHYVNGYYKSDGTYIQGHYRTDPNSTINDNYSTYPNINPYTGVQGTISPEYSGWDQEIISAPTYDSDTSFPSIDYDYDPYW